MNKSTNSIPKSFLLILSALTFTAVNYLYAQDEKIHVYGGINLAPLTTNDFVNFDVSDWERFGLKIHNSSSLEGRVRLPLKDNDVSGAKLGLLVGAVYPLQEKLGALGEIQYSFSGDLKLFGAFLGIKYDAVSDKKFTLGVTPKIGYLVGEVDFGEIELIPGYTPPVIITQGTFTNGDTLSMDIEGLGLQIGIIPSYSITEQISIQAQIGYALSLAKAPKVSVNDGKIEIEMSDIAIVKPDGSGTQAGIEPAAKFQGLYFQIGVSYILEF